MLSQTKVTDSAYVRAFVARTVKATFWVDCARCEKSTDVLGKLLAQLKVADTACRTLRTFADRRMQLAEREAIKETQYKQEATATRE